jgi:hypothetical protein
MRRWNLLVGLVAGLALLAAVRFALWPQVPPSRVTPENFVRIEVGMSRAQVESILGLPGTYYTSPDRVVIRRPTPLWMGLYYPEHWITETVEIRIAFTDPKPGGVVAYKDCFPITWK